MPIQPVTHMANTRVRKFGEKTSTSTEVTRVLGTLATTLRISFITMSTFFENPHRAPIKIPMVKLIIVQRIAREMEILAPYQMALKVDCPDSPVPKIQLIWKPYFSMAAAGVRCLALGSMIFSYLSKVQNDG